jgi:hypothetical protein
LESGNSIRADSEANLGLKEPLMLSSRSSSMTNVFEAIGKLHALSPAGPLGSAVFDHPVHIAILSAGWMNPQSPCVSYDHQAEMDAETEQQGERLKTRRAAAQPSSLHRRALRRGS